MARRRDYPNCSNKGTKLSYKYTSNIFQQHLKQLRFGVCIKRNINRILGTSKPIEYGNDDTVKTTVFSATLKF